MSPDDIESQWIKGFNQLLVEAHGIFPKFGISIREHCRIELESISAGPPAGPPGGPQPQQESYVVVCFVINIHPDQLKFFLDRCSQDQQCAPFLARFGILASESLSNAGLVSVGGRMVREQPLFGMAPLLARVRMQESAVASLGNTVNGSAESSLRVRMHALRARHDALGRQIAEAEKRQEELGQELLKKLQSQPCSSELAARISDIRAELEEDRRLHGRVRQLKARVAARRSEDQRGPARELAPDTMMALRKHLDEQARGLLTIVEILKRDGRCLAIMGEQRSTM